MKPILLALAISITLGIILFFVTPPKGGCCAKKGNPTECVPC